MSDNKITQDQLEPNVMEELESGIGDLSTLSTENKDSLVAAVTEIYGKNIIADAIGEPLAVTDTFAEMGNEINSLLSSFKTNMMNNGVMVESEDKFKQLIDKLQKMNKKAISVKVVDEFPEIGEENNLYILSSDVEGYTDIVIGAPSAYEDINDYNNKIILITTDTINGSLSVKLDFEGSNIYVKNAYIVREGIMVKIPSYIFNGTEFINIGRCILYRNGDTAEILGAFVQGGKAGGIAWTATTNATYLETTIKTNSYGTSNQYNEGKFENKLVLPQNHGFTKLYAEMDFRLSVGRDSGSNPPILRFGSVSIPGYQTAFAGSTKTVYELDISNVYGEIEIAIRSTYCSNLEGASYYPTSTGYTRLYSLYIE